MAIDYISAANAYRNQLKLLQNGGNSAAPQEQTAQSSFSQLVETAAKDSVNTQTQSEALQMQSLTNIGKVELSELVTAVSSAELSLNTVVAIRDRVINAYNDIVKMPI